MAGWGVWVLGNDGPPDVALGILCERWPAGMADEQKLAWLGMLTDCLVNALMDE